MYECAFGLTTGIIVEWHVFFNFFFYQVVRSSYCISFFLENLLIGSVFCLSQRGSTQLHKSYCRLHFLCCTAFKSCLRCENGTRFLRNGSLSFADSFFLPGSKCACVVLFVSMKFYKTKMIGINTGKDSKPFFLIGCIRGWSVIV